MAWKAPEINWDGIQHEAIRRVLDPPFIVEHAALSTAYYDGGDYLAPSGQKVPFTGKRTPEEKVVFDAWHAVLAPGNCEYTIAFHAYNLALPKEQQLPLDDYDIPMLDKAGKPSGEKLEKAKQDLTAATSVGIVVGVKFPLPDGSTTTAADVAAKG